MTALKKIITATILLTMASITNSFAHEATVIDTTQPSHINNSFAVNENNDRTDIEANPAVSTKFSTLFPKATSQVWTAGADNFWVSFLNNGRKANASFTLKGKLNYIITHCAIENLPEVFSNKITSEYGSYQLFDAKEITAHGTVAYQAILKDSKGFITLKYTSEGVEEIQQVKKQ